MAGCVLEYSQWRETPSSPTSELREGGDVKDMSTEASLFFHRIASGNYSDPLRIERQVTLERGAPQSSLVEGRPVFMSDMSTVAY